MFTRTKRPPRPSPIDLTVLGFGTVIELAETYGSLEAAQRAWERHRPVVIDAFPNGMPNAWWIFEPGIPADLRHGPHLVLTRADRDAWDDLEGRRRRYLAGDPG